MTAESQLTMIKKKIWRIPHSPQARKRLRSLNFRTMPLSTTETFISIARRMEKKRWNKMEEYLRL